MSFLRTIVMFAFTIALFVNTLSAQDKNMQIGGEVSLAMPMGDFGDAYGTGFGVTGVFTYALNPQLFLTGSIGYISFGEKFTGISFSTIPLNGGVQYRFNPGEKFQPYVGAETLFFFSSSTVETGFFGSVSASSTDFGFTPLVGAAFPMSQNLEIRANLKYHIIFTSGSSTGFLGIGGGVHFRI